MTTLTTCPPPTSAAAVGSASEELLALLIASLEQHRELDLTTLDYHLEQSQATACEGHWHSAVNEARSVIEALIVGMADAESDRRHHLISGGFPGPDSRSGFHECRKYLVTVGFVDSDDMELFRHLYAIASRKGAHPGVTDEARGRLVCHLCWMASYMLVSRYAVWKSNGRHWPEDRREPDRSVPAQVRANGSWRGWLGGILRSKA